MWLRWVLIVSLLLLAGSNLAWAYKVLDFGATYTYLDGEYDDCTQRSKQLSEIALHLGSDYNKAGFLGLVARASAGEGSFEKDGAVWIGQLGFVFVEDRLSRIILDPDAYLKSPMQ
jgi:hypothetical protein